MQIAKLLGILSGMAGAFIAGHEPICRSASRADNALRVLRFCRALPIDWEGRFIADQLFRSSARTSANYHASCRARSRRDFVSKLGMGVEESDEAVFWLT